MSKEASIALVIIAIIIAILLLLFCILFKPIKKVILKKRFLQYVGRVVYNIALDNDFYLINELVIPLNDYEKMHIDHLLFGDKYIYLINDRSYDGILSGRPEQQKIILTNKSKSNFIDNPLIFNKTRADKLALLCNFNRSFIISIVVINDFAYDGNFESNSDDNILVTNSGLRKLIKSLENRPVAKINDEQLKFAVKDIAKLNEKVLNNRT